MTEALLHKSRRALVPLLMILVPCAALFAAPLASGAPGEINTIAGTGVEGNSGDGGPAISAELRFPYALTLDGDGNLYIVDRANPTVRVIDSSGTITTVAGTENSPGFSGDGGPATSAELNNANGVAVDDAGNLYIADQTNHRIRKVDTSGTITTVAGSGPFGGDGDGGFSGDGGPATSARLDNPSGVAVDGSGNLYIADTVNDRIRKVDTSGTITTIAGGPTECCESEGGPATLAHLSNPSDVAVDDAGNLYIADLDNDKVRKVDTSGNITTVAGSGTRGFSGDGGPATSAELDRPYRVAPDAAGNVYIAEPWNHRIRKVDNSGTITTVAGSGGAGDEDGAFSGDGGPATSARLHRPFGVAVDGSNHLYIADSNNMRVREVELPVSSTSQDAPAGGTVSTNTTTTPADPVGTSVTTPVAGTVTIAEGPTTTPDPSGYALLGHQIEITAPDTSAADPLMLDFLLDASVLSPGADESTVEVFRNGTVIADCDAGAGTSATPDPCVATRAATGSGIELTVRTSHASSWNFGLAVPPQTTITSGPSGTTHDPTPTLGFTSSLAGSSFECKLDAGAYSACISPKTTTRLADGSHTFYVRATKNALTDATPATRTFTVKTAVVSRSGSTLTVTAAPGAKDNLVITKPSASTLRVADPPSGPYAGSGVHAGAGCMQDGDNAATCASAGMVTLINVAAGDQTDNVKNSTSIKASLDGGAQDDTLLGGSAADTLTGAAGVDTLKGMGGADLLKARDLASDTLIDCGIGTDKADLDTLPKDPNSVVSGCETKTRH